MIWAGLVSALVLGMAALAEDYSNPIRNGPDPFVVWDNATSSYYLLNTPGNQLHITAASTLNQLKTAEKVKVYQDQSMKDSGKVWAPEVHQLDGKWYIYYTQDEKSYVVTGGTHPLDPYSNPVLLYEEYGIDGTVLMHANTPYYIWSCRRPMPDTGANEQSLCISKLLTPTKIDVDHIGLISQPTLEWERHGRPLNEGPVPLYWAGETYLVYSGSFCFSADYSLGLLHLVGDDPMLPASWQKSPNPVLTPANGQYSTGHNGIFISPDGTELWNVFHTSTNPQGSCGTDRETFAMKIDVSQFASKGPIFGTVEAPGPTHKGPSGEDERLAQGGHGSASISASASTSASASASAIASSSGTASQPASNSAALSPSASLSPTPSPSPSPSPTPSGSGSASPPDPSFLASYPDSSPNPSPPVVSPSPTPLPSPTDSPSPSQSEQHGPHGPGHGTTTRKCIATADRVAQRSKRKQKKSKRES